MTTFRQIIGCDYLHKSTMSKGPHGDLLNDVSYVSLYL